ncbi:Cloroperoxidase [Mycena capillaripes]|nr:Cloroperoxidase [Mycena capillaripes]
MYLVNVALVFMAVKTTKTLALSVYSSEHQWIKPKVTDVRSPCPGLNTLANHGFLPRDGKNISIPMILNAASDVYDFQPGTILAPAKLGLLTGNDPTTLNLDALALHNLIEVDASLSRNDFATGDNLHFNETVFSTLANANPGVDYYNTTSAGRVQHERLADSIATNPNVTNAHKDFVGRSGTSAFYLIVMGDPLTGVAPKKFVQIFFREERLPIAEGWKRSTIPITPQLVGAISNEIMEASDWAPTQACGPFVLGPGITL